MLLAVANKGMATADCAPEQPYEASSPITGSDQDPVWKYRLRLDIR
ncbi:hypothetical protein [Streptomyces oceani]|nr:hypothetical protein [Streptomyces oceani]